MSTMNSPEIRSYNCLPRSQWKKGAITKNTPGAITVEATSQDEALLKACTERPWWLLDKVLCHPAVVEPAHTQAIKEAKERAKQEKLSMTVPVITVPKFTKKKAKCKVWLKGKEPFLADGYEVGEHLTCLKYQEGWQVSVQSDGMFLASVGTLKEGTLLIGWIEGFLQECEYSWESHYFDVLREVYRMKCLFSWMKFRYDFRF